MSEEKELKIKEKEIVHSPENEGNTGEIPVLNTRPLSNAALNYFDNRENDYQNLLDLISDVAQELADLKFRKSLMESDFPALLNDFHELFIKQNIQASTISKEALLEYFTFELLKPLESSGLRFSSEACSTWETKHFSLVYRLENDYKISLHLMMPASDGTLREEQIHLMDISPEEMQITILNEAILTLLIDCYNKHIYTSGQNSIFGHQINDVLANMKKLGFEIAENLLDNSNPLHLSFIVAHRISEETLDDIFILTMANERYDLKTLTNDEYRIQLENHHTVDIKLEESKTIVKLNTANSNKSLIEFFGAYPFLVSLLIH